MNIAATQLGLTQLGATQVVAAQLGATQIGLLGNAILVGPGSLAGTLTQLGDRIFAGSVQEAKPALAALLDALEDQDEGRPDDLVSQLRLSFTALQLLNGGVSRLDLSPIARRLSQIPADSYKTAADKAAHSINAAVRLPSRHTKPSPSDTLLLIKNQMQGLHRLLHSTLTPEQIPFVMRSLIRCLEDGRNFLEQVYAGAREEPAPEILKEYLPEWLIVLNDLREYGLKHYPGQTRKILWEQIRLMGLVVPFEILESVAPRVPGTFARAICRFLEDVLSHEARDFIEEREYWANLNRLIEFGLIPSVENLKDQKGLDVPAGEKWPEGESLYLSEVLWPAFEQGFTHVCEISNGGFLRGGEKPLNRKKVVGFFSAGLASFQKMRALFPDTHDDLLLMLMLMEIYRGHSRVIPKKIFYKRFSTLIDVTARRIAALPPEIFEKYRDSIRRDFPEAIYFRDGLKSNSLKSADLETIQRWLPLRPEEKMVMHIGVRGDLEFVRQSVRQISRDGQVVLVDKDPKVFKPFLEDPEIRKAHLDGLLKLETKDYHGEGSWYFRNKYRRLVNRVYLLHPVGDPAPVMQDIVAPGGLVFYQNTDKFFGRRYLSYDRALFVEGDFERLVSYTNGPAVFATETAKKLGELGIRFSIGRRKRNN